MSLYIGATEIGGTQWVLGILCLWLFLAATSHLYYLTAAGAMEQTGLLPYSSLVRGLVQWSTVVLPAQT